MTGERDPYAVLGVASTATPEEVVAAYRALARRHHPDVSAEADAEHRMAEINAAWSVLRDPAKRAEWDQANAVDPPSTASETAAARARKHAPRAHDAGAARPGARHGSVTWRRGPAGEGAAGPPPGNPRGSVLPFGRHIGWSIGEIARIDPGYLVWLQPRREGAPYREEIGRYLAPLRAGPAAPEPAPAARKRRLFR
jgi:curved DNA-binding protein CbpA